MNDKDMVLFKHDSDQFTSGIKGMKSEDSPDISPGELLYEDKYQKIYNFKADFGSHKKEYVVRDSGSRAGMLAVRDGCMLFVRQYRLFLNRFTYEIPGGKIDEGESPEDAAVRECLEETGVRCLNPKPLIFYHLALDAVYCPTYMFCSEKIADLHESSAIHPEETTGWEWVSLDRCIDMIAKGEIADSFTIIGILSYQTFLNKKKHSPIQITSIKCEF
jgi:ADP-ribose pyrophosphatase